VHRLVRQVRFSITPFSKRVETGANSYASKPCGEGLSLFLGLWVEVAGPVDPDTGFVINVTEIDRLVRRHVVPSSRKWSAAGTARRSPCLLETLLRRFAVLGACFRGASRDAN